MNSVFLLVLVLVFCGFVAAVPVPYDLCSSSQAHIVISSITSNEWPPVKGDTLNLTVSGTVDEDVTSGTYSINIKLDGFPLPAITGNIDEFHPLPWTKGPLTFSFPEPIPDGAPGGTYNLQVSAVDQNKGQLFCVSLNFKLPLATTTATDAAGHHSRTHLLPNQRFAGRRSRLSSKGINPN